MCLLLWTQLVVPCCCTYVCTYIATGILSPVKNQLALSKQLLLCVSKATTLKSCSQLLVFVAEVQTFVTCLQDLQ